MSTQSDLNEKIAQLLVRRDEISDNLQERPPNARALLDELWDIAGEIAEVRVIAGH